MSTFHSYQEYMRYFEERDKKAPVIKRSICEFLRVRLPRQFKRLCFMSSVAAILNPLKSKDEIIDVLFHTLHLGHSPYAVEAPVIAAQWLWKGELLKLTELLKRAVEITYSYCVVVNPDSDEIEFISDIPDAEVELQAIVDEIIRIAPSWMIYHDTDNVARDLSRLIGHFTTRPAKSIIL